MATLSQPDNGPLLSVVIPAYNEIGTIDRILAAVRAVDIDAEIIVVDDFSTDGTRDRLKELAQSDNRLRVFITTAIKAKQRLCEPVSPRQPANSWSFRMPIWNTTPANSQNCSSHFWTIRPTLCLAPVLPVTDTIARIISGIHSAIDSLR